VRLFTIWRPALGGPGGHHDRRPVVDRGDEPGIGVELTLSQRPYREPVAPGGDGTVYGALTAPIMAVVRNAFVLLNRR
jgi:hypothetical protein